jgi:hypothetical protein
MQPGDREPTRFRRPARKMGGAEFLQSFEKGFRSDPSTGHWCRSCNERHPWKKMGLMHERDGKAWKQMWLCPKTGAVIGETLLEAKDDD